MVIAVGNLHQDLSLHTIVPLMTRYKCARGSVCRRMDVGHLGRKCLAACNTLEQANEEHSHQQSGFRSTRTGKISTVIKPNNLTKKKKKKHARALHATRSAVRKSRTSDKCSISSAWCGAYRCLNFSLADMSCSAQYLSRPARSRQPNGARQRTTSWRVVSEAGKAMVFCQAIGDAGFGRFSLGTKRL